MANVFYTERDAGGNLAILCRGEPVAWLDRESLALRELRFRPGGVPLIQIQQVCWTVIPNGLYPCLWDTDRAEIGLETPGITELRIFIKVTSLDGKLSNVSELSVCFSEERQHIVYRVKQALHVHGEFRWFTTVREIGGRHYAQLEYTDPYFTHIVGPATPVTGIWPGIWLPGQECDGSLWRKRWQMVAYEREDGVVEGCLHSHVVLYPPWKVKEGGFLGVFDDKVGNPVYRFLGDTARKGRVEQCCWGYDLHFFYLKECETLERPGAGEGVLRPGEVYEAEYEITALGIGESEEVTKKAVIFPLSPQQQEASLLMPAYVAGINRFRKGMAIEDPHSFPWQAHGGGAIWDKTFGYDDDCSLKLVCCDDEWAEWNINVGQENFMQAIVPGGEYRLSAHVFKERLDGGRLSMGVGFGVPRYPGKSGEVYPVECHWLSIAKDTDGWVRRELAVEAPQGAIWAAIVFRLEGPGCIWIDNVEFGEV